MAVAEEVNHPWTRKHDDPRTPLFSSVSSIVYPKNLNELIEVCSSGRSLKAAGSHWGLSFAATSDDRFIETNDPSGTHPTLSKTLHNVVPYCLNKDYLRHMSQAEDTWYLIHVESGKRICQLYGELDQLVDITDVTTLGGYITKNVAGTDPAKFAKRWGFATLGGAGGQTIVGGFSTGTHGGDFDRGPIADSVLAIHLVADGGEHFWIEPDIGNVPPLVDDDLLRAEYGPQHGYPTEVQIVRNNQAFHAAVMSVGRFGAIYSIVLKAVPQYSLYERRRLDYWQNVKLGIAARSPALFDAVALVPNGFKPKAAVTGPQRFLQIALCLAPLTNGTRNRVGITWRWPLALLDNPPGRKERVGDILNPTELDDEDPVFSNVGKGPGFTPNPNDPSIGRNPSMLEIACANGSFFRGVIAGVITDIRNFCNSGGGQVSIGIASVAAAGGTGLATLIPALLLILAVLDEVLDFIGDDTRFSEVLNELRSKLLDPSISDPQIRAAGVFTWRLVYNEVFDTQQDAEDYEAVSYAVMDKTQYGDMCLVNVDSVEVFFDAMDSRLIAYVDALIAFEEAQEHHGKSMVGYASLRFTGPSTALLGPEQFDTTCVVEIATLRDVSGGQDLLDYAVKLALNPNIGGILHWGQRNDSNRSDIDRLFGPMSGYDRIGQWRAALDLFTGGGDNNAFSSSFTRMVGLEK
ncbi:MAG: hypothetical protein WCB92_36065 [Mycobacterium sp.]